MKVAFYCESPADREAMAVFTESILGTAPEKTNMDLEAHSVPGFFGALAGVFKGVHYNSDAEGLVIVVDNDRAPMHEATHDTKGGNDKCRL